MKPTPPHGTRSRYFYHRCRCELCREANARYQRDRRRVSWRGFVPATAARKHIIHLTSQHVGARVIQDVTGIDRRTVYMIRSERVKKVQARTSDLILSVHPEARADKSLVDAAPTWRIIDYLLEEGIAKKELARRLGSRARNPMLQFNRHKVTARNAMKVARLFSIMIAGDDEVPKAITLTVQ